MVNGPHEILLPAELLESGGLVKDSVRGIFNTREELDDYEKLWHCHIYQPTWSDLQDKVSIELSMTWLCLLSALFIATLIIIISLSVL